MAKHFLSEITIVGNAYLEKCQQYFSLMIYKENYFIKMMEISAKISHPENGVFVRIH